MLKKKLKSFFISLENDYSHIDQPEMSLQRAKIIQKKPFLKMIYLEWYQDLIRSLSTDVKGSVLELGSGGGFMKDHYEDLITSDILKIPNPDIDIILNGHHLPIQSSSLKGILMLDVLHHLPNVELFFHEASRCIKPGGQLIMIEPWITPWSRLIYKYFHDEPLNSKSINWNFQNGGPLSMANIALPWIVFNRDMEMFKQKFPEMTLNTIKLHTPFMYLLSGGMSLKLSLPSCMFLTCRRIENFFLPWMNTWAMFATITLVRNEN